MNVTLPTPAEQATIDRHGIFDPERVEAIDLSAIVPCVIPGCDREAAWRVSMRCCGSAAVFCGKHGPKVIRRMRRRLERTQVPQCLSCDHMFPAGSTLEDIARVVEL